MTKIDEIEMRVKAAEPYLNSGVTPQSVLTAYVEDVPFLIRAVRQLGAVARIAQGVKTLSLNLALESLDPDILELIESDISVVANEGAENKGR